jgi:leucyl-tRNA synthetase
MFASPPDQSLEWNEAGVEGMARFLRRFWRDVVTHASQPDHPQMKAAAEGRTKHLPPLAGDDARRADGGNTGDIIDPASLTPSQKAMRRQLHETIAKVGDDIGRRRNFNTAIAALMELLNALSKFDDMSDAGRALRHETLETMVLLLNPFTPHTSHALWQALGHRETLVEDVPWPRADPAALVRDSVTLAVQVNGKLRGTLDAAPDAPREQLETAARALPGVIAAIGDKNVRKVIVVPGKIVNIVVG